MCKNLANAIENETIEEATKYLKELCKTKPRLIIHSVPKDEIENSEGDFSIVLRITSREDADEKPAIVSIDHPQRTTVGMLKQKVFYHIYQYC